jgi:hypothetical protein
MTKTTHDSPVIACNLNALDPALRPRYNDLVRRLRTAMRERSELPNGYTFRLEGASITLPEVAEWMSMERLCCPFLSLQLSALGNQTDWLLNLTGPDGVKPILEGAFPSN